MKTEEEAATGATGPQTGARPLRDPRTRGRRRGLPPVSAARCSAEPAPRRAAAACACQRSPHPARHRGLTPTPSRIREKNLRALQRFLAASSSSPASSTEADEHSWNKRVHKTRLDGRLLIFFSFCFSPAVTVLWSKASRHSECKRPRSDLASWQVSQTHEFLRMSHPHESS